MQVPLYKGLQMVQDTHCKLYADGLDEGEYMHWVDGRGICYTDGTFIGKDAASAYDALKPTQWVNRYLFYV